MNLRREFVELVHRLGSVDKTPDNLQYLNSESFGMYRIYLCELAGKSMDRGLLPFLVDNCLIPETLLEFGDAAVEPVLSVLNSSGNDTRKMSAISVLAEMLRPKKEHYVAAGETRTKIKKALIDALTESDQYIRQNAVRALGVSGDEDVIPVLEKVAKGDPHQFEDPEPLSGAKIIRFPVRAEAEKALKNLKKKNQE